MGQMKLSTVIYVDDVQPVLDFYQRAFGIGTAFVDVDVQLPDREPGRLYRFAALDVAGGALHLATHDLGRLLIPGYTRPPDGKPRGIEIAFETADVAGTYQSAMQAGAEAIVEPKLMPWGQTVAYVWSIEGTYVGICSPATG
jgi:uncharacterized glyoxalase superfamily protein PhnB